METITSLIATACNRFGTRTAFLHKIGGSWQETSYRVLQDTSRRLAAGLARSGFGPGDHAALLARSCPLWVVTYLAILEAGGVVVPIDPELKDLELTHILAHSDAQVMFADELLLDPVLRIAHELPALRRIVVLPPDDGGGRDAPSVPFRSVLPIIPLEDQLHDEEVLLPRRSPHDTALIVYTSGTTGRPKGAMLSHGNIVSNICGTARHMGIDETIHTLSFLPINHIFEQVCGILLPLSVGGRISFSESLKKLGDNLAEVRPTFFVGVPALYRMILDRTMKRVEGDWLSRLLFRFPPTRPLVTAGVRKKLGSGTIFISGGAALDPAVAASLQRLGVTVYQGYGITETSPVISAESPRGSRMGSVGRVLDGVEVRIAAPAADGAGEILVRGPNVMQGYLKDPAATADAFSDGWYRTGDVGRLDADGFLTICGRVKNVIVTPNGKNVYPEEVENEILSSRYIAEAVVYAHRKDGSAEEIHAIVHPRREALEAYAAQQGQVELAAGAVEALMRREVAAACSRLADYKRVRKVVVSEEEFPKTTSRKVKRLEVDVSSRRVSP